MVEYGWSFNAANRMTQYVNSIDGTVDYTNDNTGQLTGADYDYQTDESYVYDENGNRVTANADTYVTGDANQLLSDGTYRYVYDEEGNRTIRYVDENSSGTLNSGDTDISSYTWDHRNRLSEVSHFDTCSDYVGEDPDQVVEYSYDYQNRLVCKVLDSDGDGDTDASTVFVNDGNQVALQFDKSGTGSAAASDLSRRYLWGAAVDQILADEQVTDLETAGNVLWPLVDHLNTVRDLATYNSQSHETTIANHRIFDAFGKMTDETNSAVECLFGYTGRMFDKDTGLQNNLNRWYDAQVGRWASEDPIGFWGGDVNLSRNVRNSPLLHIDPSGLARLDPFANLHDKDRLIVAAHHTHVSIWGKDQCDRWADAFITAVRGKGNYTLEKAVWTFPIPGIDQVRDLILWPFGVPAGEVRVRHVAVKVTFPNGEVVYFDNGWWGGSFFGQAINNKFTEPRNYLWWVREGR